MKKHLRGITLIELLVVLAIISILALVAYAGLSGARDEARKATVKADMDTLRPAAELYLLKNAANPYQYTGFCTSSAITTVETACKAVYPNCCDCTGDDPDGAGPLGPTGACSDSATTFSVQCACTTAGFIWTCTPTGCQ